MTTPLDALKAALEACDRSRTIAENRFTYDSLHALLTDDTIAALIAVAEAAWEHLEYCDGSGYPIPDALAPLMKEAPDA